MSKKKEKTKKEKEIIVKNRHRRQLWKPLTDKEIQERSKRVSHELQCQLDDLRNKEDTVKGHAKGIKSQIETIETEQSQLSREAREGKILAQVECEEIWNYQDHTIKVKRLDSGEIVEDRKMTTGEASTLPMEDGTAPGKPEEEPFETPPEGAAVTHSDPNE